MKSTGKRLWGQNIDIHTAADIAIEWCVRSREKNILHSDHPRIYQSYLVKGVPPIDYMTGIGQLFKFSVKDTPYTDRTRNDALKCLAVAIKAHYFLLPESRVTHEPYFFIFPDAHTPSITRCGIVYPLLSNDKSIIVYDFNPVDAPNEKNAIIHQFPVALTKNSYKWFSIKDWQKFRLNDRDRAFFEKEARQAKTMQELAKSATVLNIDYDIKDVLKPLGIEWSKQVKTWYLPKGFDLDSVAEYSQYAQSKIVASRQNKK